VKFKKSVAKSSVFLQFEICEIFEGLISWTPKDVLEANAPMICPLLDLKMIHSKKPSKLEFQDRMIHH
jgi:hypothetical protein